MGNINYYFIVFMSDDFLKLCLLLNIFNIALWTFWFKFILPIDFESREYGEYKNQIELNNWSNGKSHDIGSIFH